MKQKILLSALLAATVSVAGCATYQGQQEQTGMVIGGILGGVLGNQVGGGHGRTAAIIAGTLAGAAIGGAIGHSMDETDRMRTAQTLETVRTGVPSASRSRRPTALPADSLTAAGGYRTRIKKGTACCRPLVVLLPPCYSISSIPATLSAISSAYRSRKK